MRACAVDRRNKIMHERDVRKNVFILSRPPAHARTRERSQRTFEPIMRVPVATTTPNDSKHYSACAGLSVYDCVHMSVCVRSAHTRSAIRRRPKIAHQHAATDRVRESRTRLQHSDVAAVEPHQHHHYHHHHPPKQPEKMPTPIQRHRDAINAPRRRIGPFACA